MCFGLGPRLAHARNIAAPRIRRGRPVVPSSRRRSTEHATFFGGRVEFEWRPGNPMPITNLRDGGRDASSNNPRHTMRSYETCDAINEYADNGPDDVTDYTATNVAHPADAAFAFGINNAPWSDPIVRGKALYELGCAAAGTVGTDRSEWLRRLTEGTIRRVLPIALRSAAEVHPETAHKDALRHAADRCEEEGTRAAAKGARIVASAAATTPTGYSATRAAHYAAAAAHYAAAARADATAYAVGADRAARTVRAANAATFAAANAAFGVSDANAAYAADYGDYAGADRDRDNILAIAVDVVLDAYRAEGRS